MLSDILTLTLYLIINLLTIILIGNLIFEYSSRDKTNRKGFNYLFIICFFILIFYIIENIRFFTDISKEFFWILDFSFVSVILFLIFLFSYANWEKINKSLLYLFVFTNFSAAIFELFFKIRYPALFDFVNVFFIFLGLLFFYFFILDFLMIKNAIKESKKTKQYHKKLLFYLVSCFLIFIIVLSLFYFIPYIQKSKFSGELNIYNWDTYVAEDTISNFENIYGIKVNYKTFEDDNLMFEELKSNSGEYDLVVAEGNLIKEMIKLNLLSELNKKNLPNFKNLDEKFINQNYDSENKYSVPYMWGTTALIINTKYIPEDTDSWDVLWNNKYSGKIGLLLNSEEAIAMTSKYVGGPLIPQNHVQFEKIKKFLLLQKPLLKGYILTVDLQDLLVSEELWALNIYNGNAVVAIAENPNLKYIIPKEGATIWIDNWAIPKNAKNKRNAELFLNYILEPKVNADITNEVKYATANKAAEEFLDSEVLLDPIIYPDEETIKRLDSFANYEFSDEMNLKILEFWNELTGGEG